jgi:hypothetical protein
MGCRTFGVTPILVGLFRIGVVGLKDALLKVEQSGLSEREAILDLLVESLAGDNYIPERQQEAYRLALWREYLRARGEDIRELFSEIEVTVRAEAGEARQELEADLQQVLAELELKPIMAYKAPAEGEDQLVLIRNETVARGRQTRQSLQTAVRRSVGDW